MRYVHYDTFTSPNILSHTVKENITHLLPIPEYRPAALFCSSAALCVATFLSRSHHHHFIYVAFAIIVLASIIKYVPA